MIMTGTPDALTSLRFAGQKGTDYTSLHHLEEQPMQIFTDTARWLDEYFKGKEPGFTPKLALNNGTPFQLMVWNILRIIPYGAVVTYKDVAKEVAVRLHKASMSSQAIGSAVGRNPVVIIIPCHRVIGSDGSLTGYAAGVDRKSSLLTLEQQHNPTP